MKLSKYALTVALLCSTSAIAFSQPENYIEFNGTDQYVTIPSHEDFNIELNEDFSITCWVNVNKLVNGQRFVSRRAMGETTQTTGYEMWGGGNSTQYYAINTPLPGGGNVMSDWCKVGSGETDTWMHLAMVIDRSTNTIRIYRDGVEGNQKTNNQLATWSVVNNLDVYLGAGCNANTKEAENYMTGKLANVRFWSKALSDEEVEEDMDSTVGEGTANLIAAYDFKNIQGLTIPDISGNGHNATMHGYAPVGGSSAIYSVSASMDSNFTGRGNSNEVASQAKVIISGEDNYNLKSIKLNLAGTTDYSDITSVKVYATNSASFDPRNVSGATLLGSCTPDAEEMECQLEGSLPAGTQYLWVTFDVAENAKEGNKISIKATELDGVAVSNSETASREILLARKLIFAPGDYNSKYYRIPAIITAEDGTLVTVTDKRKYDQGDLPGDIDLLIRRSKDGGKTWEEPIVLAEGQGQGKGFGDAGIVRTNEEGGLLCVFVGGQGLWNSTSYNPIRTYVSKSTDNGQTWSEPRDITDQIFGNGCSDATRKYWQASFCASGRGLLTSTGRIMFVAAIRHSSSNTLLYNHVIYSDDNGETWHVSDSAIDNGDESKVVELNDGRILMSIRRHGNGPRYYNISEDNGETWGQYKEWTEMQEPGCNGDMVRYTSTKDGYDKDRILHTVPNATSRINVTMFLSYDEGQTWALKKSLCKTGSAYSSITVLEDGTIGVYTEENYNTDAYSTYFLNFSLDWLTDGADQYSEPTGKKAVETPKFSLEGGYYTEEQTLEITTATDGASIYYTLDGTTPSKDSNLYTEPLKLSETVTVKAIAMKEGMNNSAMASATYTFLTEWEQPTGTVHSTEDRYVTSATTSGAVSDLNYTQTSNPNKVFIDTNAEFTVKQGQTFTLNVKSTDQMVWCHAVLFADWNRDFDFYDEGETLMRVGKDSYEDANLYKEGNLELKDFTVEITVPRDAKVASTRLRIQFTDAWHDKSSGHTHTAMDAIDKGGCYDFVMNIVEGDAVAPKLTLNEPENGSIEVRYEGESDLLANNADLVEGKNVEITLVPDNKYMASSLVVNDTEKISEVSDNKLVVAVPAEGLNIVAAFEKVAPKLTFNEPENGSIEVKYEGESDLLANNADLVEGKTLEITVVPAESYVCSSLLINDVEKVTELSDNKTTYTVADEDINIVAEFTLGVGIQNYNSDEIKVYPTIVSNDVKVLCPAKSTVKVYSVSGQLVMTAEACEGENTIATSQLAKGNYIMQIVSAESNKTVEFVKE